MGDDVQEGEGRRGEGGAPANNGLAWREKQESDKIQEKRSHAAAAAQEGEQVFYGMQGNMRE